ncbi:MAG: phage tail tape measure protein [Pseudomonadota bacterium]
MATGGALIGALRVALGLDSAQFEAGSKRARQTAKSDVSAIQREFDRLKTIGSSLAGIWASSEIIAAGKRALDYASSLGEVAQQLGVSTKELQQYRYAASQAGVSQDEMDKGLAKLTRTIGEAKAGGKAQATTFRELGVAIQDANGRVYSAGEVIPKLADALSKIKDPATRARVEVDLFGKAGQKLDTLLAGGSAAVNELRDAAQRLGVVLSDDQIQKADETADKLAAVKMVLESRIAGVVSDNADAILKIGDALGYAAGQVGQFFKNMQGVERLKRDEGWATGFFSGWDEQATAADPTKYLQMRTGNLTRATADRKKAEAANTGKDYFGFGGKAVRDARAKEAEALRLVRAAKSDPALQAAIERERARRSATSSPIGDGVLPTAAGAPKKTPKSSGPSAAEIEAKSQQELSRLRQEQIQAELSLTTDAEKRADLQSQLLLEEFSERSAQIANDEHFTVAQKAAQQAALKALYGVSGEGDNIVVGGNKNSLSSGIARDLSEKLAQQAYEVQAADLNAKRAALQGQLNLARTADDRRRIELEILDLEYKLRAAKLDQVINSQESSKAEKDLAQMAKDRLDGQRALDTANVERQNMGPMASYLDSLPKTAGEVNEAFEQIAANGLANMNDQLANAAANTLKLKGLAGQLFNQLIADVIRLNLQQATGGGGSLLGGLLKASTSLFGGGAGLGGVSSSSLSALDTQANAISTRNLTGLATGGTIGGFPGVDKNVLSINGIPTARVSANERIRVEPNSANDNSRGGGGIAMIVPSPLFEVVMRKEAASVAAPMSAQAASGGSIGAQKAMARANSRRLA